MKISKRWVSRRCEPVDKDGGEILTTWLETQEGIDGEGEIQTGCTWDTL